MSKVGRVGRVRSVRRVLYVRSLPTLLTLPTLPTLLRSRRSRCNRIQVPPQRIHLHLEPAIHDEEPSYIGGQIHAKDDREEQGEGKPDSEVQHESLTAGIQIRDNKCLGSHQGIGTFIYSRNPCTFYNSIEHLSQLSPFRVNFALHEKLSLLLTFYFFIFLSSL